MPQKHIIYIIDGSIALTGAFVCARNIAEALEGEASIILVVAEDCVIDSQAMQSFYAVHRLPIRRLRRSFWSVLLYLPFLFISSFKLLRKMRIDKSSVLIVNDFYLMQGAVIRFFGFRGKIITWVRINPSVFGHISKIFLFFVKKTSNKIVGVSRYIESILPSGFVTDILYDSVSPTYALQVPQQSQANKTFVFLGNYIAGKGQDLAIEALAHIIPEFPNAYIEFYGGNMGLAKNLAYRRALEDRANSLNIMKHVSFGDFVTNPQTVLVGKYAALNLSRSESFSMTALEASACGLAVIATRSGGPEEIIKHYDTGILIPVGDVMACVTAMLDLCRDPALTLLMGQQGRIRVLSEFSQTRFQQRLFYLLDITESQMNINQTLNDLPNTTYKDFPSEVGSLDAQNVD